jgi:hypothetical protein
MKPCITLTFLLVSFLTNAQFTDGLYESSGNSYRKNYYLLIQKEKITYFGWETSIKKDTVYFKSTANLKKNNNLTFEKFDYSLQSPQKDQLPAFPAQTDIRLDTSFLKVRVLRYLQLSDQSGKIMALAVKDAYDSRGDRFEFVKMR